MTTTENTTRPSNNTITRRKMLQSVAVTSAATVMPTIALTSPFLNVARAGEVGTETAISLTPKEEFDAACEAMVKAAIRLDPSIGTMWAKYTDLHLNGRFALTGIGVYREDAATPIEDPLVSAIDAFRLGNVAYSQHPIVSMHTYTDEEHDVAIEETYGPPMRVLEEWNSPAASQPAATAALNLAQNEIRQFGNSDIAAAMIAAAMGYLNRFA